MTGAPASVLPAADVVPAAPPVGGAATTDTAADAGPTRSFTDVLSEHAKGSRHEEGRRDSDVPAKTTGPEPRHLPGRGPGVPSDPADPLAIPADAARPVPPAAGAPSVGLAHDDSTGSLHPPARTPVQVESTHVIDPTPPAKADTAVSAALGSAPDHAPAAGPGSAPPTPAEEIAGSQAPPVPAAKPPARFSSAVAPTDVDSKPRADPGRGATSAAPRVVPAPATGPGTAARDQLVPPSADRPGPPAIPPAHPLPGSSLTPHDPIAAAPVARTGPAGAIPALARADQPTGALDVGNLAGSISRPLSDGNGAYTVTVAMHPSDLGHLRAVMSLEGNELQVVITPDTRLGHEALANAAEALKNQLASAGLNVNVTLRDPGSSSGGDDDENGQRSSDRSPDGLAAALSSMPEPVAGQIHLVL